MAEAEQICLAILAAGRSERFGEQDKLTAILHGKMLGLHAAETLEPLQFCDSYVIASSVSHPCTAQWKRMSYEVHVNENSNLGLATSVAKAASLAKNSTADGLMICLADMPFIPQSHYEALIQQYDISNSSGILSSTDGKKNTPPALFGRSNFEALTALEGDGGARAMLRQHPAVQLSSAFLIDIDHPETLEKSQNMELNRK